MTMTAIDENDVVIHDGKSIPQIDMPKDPDSILDYGISWGDWLRDSETITSSAWAVEAGGFVIENETFLVSDTVGNKTYTHIQIVWLSGGTEGVLGTLRNRIVTSLGRTEDRSFKLLCQNK